MAYDKRVLADNLRAQRARKRMTQAQVAKAIGVSEATIVNYESGEGGMSYANAWALADLFDATIDELGGRPAAV